MIKDKPRHWHETLSEALWAYRNSKRTSTGTTPYRLTFGYDVVLLMELNVKLAMVALQHNLIPFDYNEAMFAELEDLDEVQKLALDHLMVHKAKVMKAYNKRVKFKSFAEGDMVWQTILPPRKVDRTYGKWLPTWKGPYLVYQVLHGGAYKLKDLDGEVLKRPINGRYLKKYQPTIFELIEEKKASNESNIEDETSVVTERGESEEGVAAAADETFVVAVTKARADDGCNGGGR
ncbi:uncharacterized protein LOC132270186 [Cornus florida]|uniref:uncharacterized protein LOC132270186 n=1 Tax=Cornus florida TaxID=4283 RepID=UPI002897E481|nr:uncharacterized protein LOC132270186 [Cornus florida]